MGTPIIVSEKDGLPALDLLGRLSDLPTTISVANLGAGVCASPISKQVLDLTCSKLVNIEIFPEYFNKLVGMTFKATVVENVKDDVVPWVAAQDNKSYDVVLIIDLLEHMTQPIAEWFLVQCKRIALRRVLIWVPLGYCPQAPYDLNPWQEHKSTWQATHFGGATVQYFRAFHKHFDPPVDAAWVTYENPLPL